MRDIGGFVALLLIIFVVLYLTVRWVIPFLLLYAGGVVLFFLATSLLLRRGLRYPAHFSSMLKPGYGPTIALLALVLPAAHALTLHTFKLSDSWLMVGAFNLALPVIWTTRELVLHFRQSSRFNREGYDIEEVVEGSRDRAGLLDLKIELLTAADQSRKAPEPWETAAGVLTDDESDLGGRIGRLTMDMKQLRAGYVEIADELSRELELIRTEQAGRENCSVQLTRFRELDALWARVSREVSSILEERTGYSPAGWE